jgi:hypothetical protein
MSKWLEDSPRVPFSFARGVLIAAAAMVVAMQFVPFDFMVSREVAEPLYKFWWWTGKELRGIGVPRNWEDAYPLLVVLAILAFHIFILAMPWLARFLQRARPLLWTARVLTSMVAGWFLYLCVKEILMEEGRFAGGEVALLGLMVGACLVGGRLKILKVALWTVRIATLMLVGFYFYAWQGNPRENSEVGMVILGLLLVAGWVCHSLRVVPSLLWLVRIFALLSFLWLLSEELLSVMFLFIAAGFLETLGLWLIPVVERESGEIVPAGGGEG